MVKITFNADRCKGCGLCVSACPKHIVSLDPKKINAQGHHTADVADKAACIGCASCATICPDCVITVVKE